MAAIEIESLTKIYKPSLFSRNSSVTALYNVSFQVNKSTIYTVLGPNGSGKTTLIRILAGLTPPTEGHAKVGGISVRSQKELVRRIGLLVSASAGFFGFRTCWENLEFFAALQNMEKDFARERISKLIEVFGLAPYAGRKIGTFSSGLRQRLLLARALLHDPEILLLDEPITYLDPFVARQFHLLLRDCLVRDLGKTVLLTTHQLEEAVEISDTLGLIYQGALRWEKPADTFRSGKQNLLKIYMETVDGHAQ